MNFLIKLIAAPTGKKAIMALSGAVWIGFLPVHLLGNLQIFFGPEAMNEYAHFLQNLGSLKWMARGIFLVSFFLHVFFAILLKRQNRAARPQGYIKENTIRASLASRSMMLSGLAILMFIIYHILHYTVGVAHSEFFGKLDPSGRHDVYSMMVSSFQNPFISTVYIAAVVLISLHVSHAFSAMFQTFGLNNKRIEFFWKRTGYLFAAAILFGFSSIPIAVLYGFIQ